MAKNALMTLRTTPHFDCTIIGAGPVGSALALWLAQKSRQPQRIALLDRAPAHAGQADPRTLALSAGSLMLLEAIISLADLPGADLTQVQVSQRGRWGRTHINAADLGVPRLGQVLRYADLMHAFAPALRASGVTLHYDTPVTALEEVQDGVRVHTPSAVWETPLVIHAEGSPSGAAQVRRDYQQTALIAEVTVAVPAHRRAQERVTAGTAFECFTAHGPIALLPAPPLLPSQPLAPPQPLGGPAQHQPAERRYALVWCVAPDQAQHVLALDEAAFCAQLHQAFGERAGRFCAVRARQAYPLYLKQNHDRAAHHIRLGNAAQTLHPVAGQGLNLGLRDAYTLARLWSPGEAEGEALPAAAQGSAAAALTRQFHAARRVDRGVLMHGTDFLARAFTWGWPGFSVAPAAGAALTLLDLCPPLRRALARQLMLGWRA